MNEGRHQTVNISGNLPQMDAHPIELLLRFDRNEDALAAAESALRDDPGRAKFYRFKALALSGMRRYPEAVSALDQAIALIPDNVFYHRLRALTLRNAGRYEEAFAALGNLLAERPDDPELLGAACVSALRLGKKLVATEAGQRRLSSLAAEALAAAGITPPLPDHLSGRIDRVAFSLWGANSTYCDGAIANALTMKDHYPGWEAVFFVGEGVPDSTRDALDEAGALVIDGCRDHAEIPPGFWRFLVHDMPGTRRYLVRDCDSRISARERVAVTEWINSGRGYHIVRDHILHFELMLGGVWGGTAGRNFVMKERIESFSARATAGWGYGFDQRFLQEMIWPWIRDDALVHDSYYDLDSPVPVPGGARGDDRDHIGMGYLLPSANSA